MKALVTGANGFVGQHLMNELKQGGHMPLAIYGPLAVTTENTLAIDLMNEAAVNAIDLTGVDTVFHLAGLAAVGASFDQARRYIDTNATMQINLFQAALLQGSKPRFIIISTGSVYDPSAPLPLTEASPTAPSSPYSVSKLTQENLAFYYRQLGFEVIVARPFNHIGPGQGEGFLVPDLVRQLTGTSHTISTGNLSSKRDYTDVRDIVRAYRLLAESGVSGKIYNICSGVSVSGDELLKLLIHLDGRKLKIEIDQNKLRPTDTNEICGDHSLITADTGWEPIIGLEQTLKDVLSERLARN